MSGTLNTGVIITMVTLLIGSFGPATASPSHEEMGEGKCWTYSTSKDVHLYEMLQVSILQGFHLVMSNKDIGYHLGLQLTGKDSPAPSNLCISGNYSGLYASNKKYLFKCTVGSLDDITCHSTAVHPHPDMQGKIAVKIVWTNEPNDTILLVLCANNKKYWMAASGAPGISPQTEETILAEISKLGFDRTKVLYQEWKQCGKQHKKSNWWEVWSL